MTAKKPAPKPKAPSPIAKLEARIDKIAHSINAHLGINVEGK